MELRFSPAVLVAALVAAVGAHVGIDIAGDYLLRDDSYDHLAHGSREIFTLVAVLCACGAGAVFVRRLFSAAGSIPGRVRLLRITRRYVVQWFAAVAALALSIVPLMETVDALRDGADVDSLADAFGGSLLLGAGVTLGCAFAVCAVIFGLVAWLCRHRHHVARLVGALLVRDDKPPQLAYAERGRASVVTRAGELRAQRRRKRGPPLRLRFHSASSR